MNLTLSLDEPLSAQLRREASTRRLSPEQVALDLLGGALGKIVDDGQQARADTAEMPPALELAGRSRRKEFAQAILTALRRLLRDLDTPGKATNLAILKRELSKAHTLADCRSEAPYRSIVTLAENALTAVPWTEIDAPLLNLLQEQLKLGLEDRPVTTDDYLRTSRILGDSVIALSVPAEHILLTGDSQSFPVFAEILGIHVQTVAFEVALRDQEPPQQTPEGGSSIGH